MANPEWQKIVQLGHTGPSFLQTSPSNQQSKPLVQSHFANPQSRRKNGANFLDVFFKSEIKSCSPLFFQLPFLCQKSEVEISE
jgi:hypothetical protein